MDEVDLSNRDPNNINDHLKVYFYLKFSYCSLHNKVKMNLV